MEMNLHDVLPPASMGERHVACVLLVDTSSSMSGVPIGELNRGLDEFGQALSQDALAYGRADVSVISFNTSVQTVVGFRPASQYEAPVLTAAGTTAFNEGIEKALDAIEARKGEYKATGVSYYRPWLFVLTDGAPTDTDRESEARSRLQKAIRNKKVVYMPMGIGPNADFMKLQSYYPEEDKTKPVLRANAENFKEAFSWLSDSMGVISRSDPNIATEVQTPPVPQNISVLTVGI